MEAANLLPEMQAQPANADEEIPVLDVGPYISGESGALQRLAREVRYALENIGFFYIQNHGVSQKLIDRVFTENARFHALPLERKMQIQVGKSDIIHTHSARAALLLAGRGRALAPHLMRG